MDRARLAAAGLVVLVATIAGALAWHRHWGATAEDIANVRLDVTPVQLAKALPRSSIEHDIVETRFRHSVTNVEEASFVFAHDGAWQVRGLHLVLEEEEQTRKSGHGDTLDQRFAALLPASEDNELERGGLHFWLSEKELAFELAVPTGDLEPARTSKKVDVARDVLVSIAFGSPAKHAAKEIADALGTGYAVADVATLELSPSSASIDGVMTRFPGAARNGKSVRIPLVHRFVMDVDLEWRTRWDSRVEYLHVDFHMTKAFRGPGELGGCLAKQPASSLLEERSQGLGTFEVTDPKTFASIVQAIDACR